MPGSLALASVSTGAVFPLSLSTSYTESLSFPVLANSYHDGTVQLSLIQDGVNAPRPWRVWKLTKRLTSAQLATLQNFWQTTASGGIFPFFFYDVFAATPIGSNYDPTGVNITGRVTAYLRNPFTYTGTLGRNNVGEFMIMEVA